MFATGDGAEAGSMLAAVDEKNNAVRGVRLAQRCAGGGGLQRSERLMTAPAAKRSQLKGRAARASLALAKGLAAREGAAAPVPQPCDRPYHNCACCRW
jgi:hypothetical protein